MHTERAKIEIRLELSQEMYEAESQAANEDYTLGKPKSLPPDPDAMEARFIGPVEIMAAITITVLAERLLHFALAKWGTGVLVDARDRPPTVSVLKGLPQGFIVIIHPDGTTEKVRADQPGNNLANLLGKALQKNDQQ